LDLVRLNDVIRSIYTGIHALHIVVINARNNLK
jgi:hypothetical protein